MQEKTLLNQANSTSNIHSSDFGSVSYDIFGSPYQKSGSFLANDSLDFGYLGKPYNADTELYDYGFRDYSPEVSRFITVDPIRDGRNWFCYVVNDPVNYVDLLGLCGSDTQKITVKTSGIEVNVITIGSVGTYSFGWFQADFYIDDNEKPSFSAEDVFQVEEKEGIEVTFLGVSVFAGTGEKEFDSNVSYEEIVKDFESAGSESIYGGLSVVVGGSVSGSTSGDWIYNQSSFGWDYGVKLPFTISAGTEKVSTTLKDGSLYVY